MDELDLLARRIFSESQDPERQKLEQIKQIEKKLFEDKNIDPNKVCFKCGKHDFKLSVKIIPTGKECLYCRIKYYPQIKKVCANCGEFKSFAKQTQDMVDELNKRLEGVSIDETD